MIYRLLKPEDFERAERLCEEHGIHLPVDGIKLLAQCGDDIKAVLGIRTVVSIEPLVSINPIASVKLFDLADSYANINKINMFRIMAEPSNEELFNKVGFEKVFSGRIIMEKYYGTKY
jgi:hypothetical protein